MKHNALKTNKSRLKWWLGVPVFLYLLLGFAPLIISPDFGGVMPPNAERLLVTTDTSEGEITVSYLRAGDKDGQRVIFVHGTPGQATGWDGFLSDVPMGYEYIAIDRPGFGKTLPLKPYVKLDDQAAALEPFLKPNKHGKPILVGHSMGGPIVAAAAANYPDQIKGIAIVAGSLDPALEEIKWFQYVALVPPFPWTLPDHLIHTNEEVFALEGELERLSKKLDRITVPVEIIHGTDDPLVPYANVPFMQASLKNAPQTLTRLDGQNHFLPWNSADYISQAIERLNAPTATISDTAR